MFKLKDKKKKGREEMKRKSLRSGMEESVSCLWEKSAKAWKQIPILDRPTCTLIFSCKRKTFLLNENKTNEMLPFLPQLTLLRA